jgi:hypothetical protein
MTKASLLDRLIRANSEQGVALRRERSTASVRGSNEKGHESQPDMNYFTKGAGGDVEQRCRLIIAAVEFCI